MSWRIVNKCPGLTKNSCGTTYDYPATKGQVRVINDVAEMDDGAIRVFPDGHSWWFHPCGSRYALRHKPW